MLRPTTITLVKKNKAIEVVVDSQYYNNNLIYRNQIKNERTQQTT